jgi:hypothetical protein
MNTKVPPPKDAPDWFIKWCNEFNRSNNDTVVRSQGKTNPTSNVQEFTISLEFITLGTGEIEPINILNKLKVNPINVVLGSISRTDGVSITGTPQITWTMDGKNIKILTIGGLVADTRYTATFKYTL